MALELPQAEPARQALADAADALRSSREKLFASAPDYSGSAKDGVRAMRQALKGMLIWHGVSFPEEAPLSDLGRRAMQLESMLRTPVQRARMLEGVARSAQGQTSLSLPERETVLTGYYTARNLLSVVFSHLPDALVPAEQELVPAL